MLSIRAGGKVIYTTALVVARHANIDATGLTIYLLSACTRMPLFYVRLHAVGLTPEPAGV
jgi:hypothetical protein